MKSIPADAFQLGNKNINQITKNSTQKHLKPQNQYKLEFEISEDKPKSTDNIKKQSEINSVITNHKSNESQNILSINRNSIKPGKGDETPKSYMSQFETINSKEEKLINNLFIKNKSENHKDYSLLNGLSINDSNDNTKRDMFPITDFHKLENIPNKSNEELSNNFILKKMPTDMSSKKVQVNSFNVDPSASNLIHNLKNCKTTPVASSSFNASKRILSPNQADTNQVNKVINLNAEGNLITNRSNTQRNHSNLSRRCPTSNDIDHNKSKNAPKNFNISTHNNYSITDRGTLIFDLEEECQEQPQFTPVKLLQNDPRKRLSSVSFNKVKKNLNHNLSHRINSKQSPDYSKYNTQELVYDLVRQYSTTKISKKEDFMQRMMFDVFKRQTKEERINRIVERSKPRLDEDQRVEGFNRLIEDANRRFDASDRIEKMKIYNETEPSMKKRVSVEPTNWEDTYRKRFLEYKLEKEFLLETKIIEKEKNKKVEEDRIVQSMIKNTKKAAKSVIKTSCDRMYSVAENIENKRKEKFKKLENLNKKYLQELCCLKLFKNHPVKKIDTVIELDQIGLNNTQNKQIVNKKKNFISTKEKKKLPTERFNFENYNYFIYNPESNENSEKNQKANQKLVQSNKEVTKESAKYNFDSDNNIKDVKTDSISKYKKEANTISLKHANINEKRSNNKSINNKSKSVINKVKIPDYLDSDNDDEYIEALPPTQTKVTFLFKELKSPNLRNMEFTKDISSNRMTNISGKYLPECMANQIVERILKDKI